MAGQDGEFYDLRGFFHAIGSFSASRALTEPPAVRLQCDVPVELLDPDPVPVTASPLAVDGFVDGVQAAICVNYRSHRPVYLTYVAAGAASLDGRLVDLREKLNVVVSHLEHDWLRDLDVNIPSVELPDERPDELAGAALANLAGDRESLERVVVDSMLSRPGDSVVVDGGLVGRPIRDRVVGVVKTTQRRYLPDESVLFGLPQGWRSPRFLIPSGSQGVSAPRYSCYVRLHDASRMAWNFGLIRLESFKPELLDPLASLALRERQPAGSHDRRFDRHLAGVRAVEDLLRARRPPVFGS